MAYEGYRGYSPEDEELESRLSDLVNSEREMSQDDRDALSRADEITNSALNDAGLGTETEPAEEERRMVGEAGNRASRADRIS